MPIGALLAITITIMVIKRGVDTPVALTAAALGDKSDGTILEGPIDMIGNLLNDLWRIGLEVFNRGGGDNPAAMATAIHLAQAAGVIG